MAMQQAGKYVTKNISEYKAGDYVQGYYYIKESELKLTTTNNKYMNFTFSDISGEINAKLWDYDEDNVKRFPAGAIVKARGNILDWQGQMQFKIELIRKTTEDDNVNMAGLIPSAPIPGEEMLSYIESVVEKIQQPQLKAIDNEIINMFRDELLIYPAAKRNHHAVRCGLLYHTSTMLKMAHAYADIYDFLDKDLLFTGVIIHDIGKIKEMKINDSGLVDEYSSEGMLLGHLIQGIKIVDNVCEKLGIDKEISMMLEHMILSHHYEPEFGSPKYPMFPEAEILHYLDITDARMYDMRKAKEATEKGKFSERIKSLDNRTIYRSIFED